MRTGLERDGICKSGHSLPRPAHPREAASGAATRICSTALLFSSVSLIAWRNRSMPDFISGSDVSSCQAVNTPWTML